MKTIVRCVAVLLPVLLLAACATTPKQAAAPQPQTTAPVSLHTISKDEAYIAYVERTARRRGIQVMWVNPPDKRLKEASASK